MSDYVYYENPDFRNAGILILKANDKHTRTKFSNKIDHVRDGLFHYTLAARITGKEVDNGKHGIKIRGRNKAEANGRLIAPIAKSVNAIRRRRITSGVKFSRTMPPQYLRESCSLRDIAQRLPRNISAKFTSGIFLRI